MKTHQKVKISSRSRILQCHGQNCENKFSVYLKYSLRSVYYTDGKALLRSSICNLLVKYMLLNNIHLLSHFEFHLYLSNQGLYLYPRVNADRYFQLDLCVRLGCKFQPFELGTLFSVRWYIAKIFGSHLSNEFIESLSENATYNILFSCMLLLGWWTMRTAAMAATGKLSL